MKRSHCDRFIFFEIYPWTIAVRTLAREPLFHFLILAGLLFVAQALFGETQREEIFVDAQTQRFLVEQDRDLTLVEPTPERIDALVTAFIEEEILVREARKRGFADNARIRALLAQNMRFFISGDVPQPTEEELRAYFEENRERFESPPSFDLEHLAYDDPAAVPEGLIGTLNAGADPNDFGDFNLAYGRVMRLMEVRRLTAAFGPDNAIEILAIDRDDSGWHGPFIAPQGSAHFIRIMAHNAPQVPEFEVASEWIAAQWQTDKSREVMDAEMNALREGYRITVEPLDAGQ